MYGLRSTPPYGDAVINPSSKQWHALLEDFDHHLQPPSPAVGEGGAFAVVEGGGGYVGGAPATTPLGFPSVPGVYVGGCGKT